MQSFKNYYLILFFFFPAILVHAGDEDSFYMVEEKTLVDHKGRHVTIDKPFERIISLYGAHTENLFYLGLDREIIGVTQADRYPERVFNKKVFSQGDDPEKYLVEKPDLVLIRPMLDRGYARLFDRLEKSGITVISLQRKRTEELCRERESRARWTGCH